MYIYTIYISIYIYTHTHTHTHTRRRRTSWKPRKSLRPSNAANGACDIAGTLGVLQQAL